MRIDECIARNVTYARRNLDHQQRAKVHDLKYAQCATFHKIQLSVLKNPTGTHTIQACNEQLTYYFGISSTEFPDNTIHDGWVEEA